MVEYQTNKDKLSRSHSGTSEVKWYSVGDNQLVLHKVYFLAFIGGPQKEAILFNSLIKLTSRMSIH